MHIFPTSQELAHELILAYASPTVDDTGVNDLEETKVSSFPDGAQDGAPTMALHAELMAAGLADLANSLLPMCTKGGVFGSVSAFRKPRLCARVAIAYAEQFGIGDKYVAAVRLLSFAPKAKPIFRAIPPSDTDRDPSVWVPDVTVDILETIWARRIALALFGNTVFPWTFNDFPPWQIGVMLDYRPAVVNTIAEFESAVINGQDLHDDSWGTTTGIMFDPEPLDSWNEAQRILNYFTPLSPATATEALVSWMKVRRFIHGKEQAWYAFGDLDVNAPPSGYYFPDCPENGKVSTYQGPPQYICTLRQVIRLRWGGCPITAAYCAAVLRAMNLPACRVFPVWPIGSELESFRIGPQPYRVEQLPLSHTIGSNTPDEAHTTWFSLGGGLAVPHADDCLAQWGNEPGSFVLQPLAPIYWLECISLELRTAHLLQGKSTVPAPTEFGTAWTAFGAAARAAQKFIESLAAIAASDMRFSMFSAPLSGGPSTWQLGVEKMRYDQLAQIAEETKDAIPVTQRKSPMHIGTLLKNIIERAFYPFYRTAVAAMYVTCREPKAVAGQVLKIRPTSMFDLNMISTASLKDATKQFESNFVCAIAVAKPPRWRSLAENAWVDLTEEVLTVTKRKPSFGTKSLIPVKAGLGDEAARDGEARRCWLTFRPWTSKLLVEGGDPNLSGFKRGNVFFWTTGQKTLKFGVPGVKQVISGPWAPRVVALVYAYAKLPPNAPARLDLWKLVWANVEDYWLLRGQVELAKNDLPGFGENLVLDPCDYPSTNTELGDSLFDFRYFEEFCCGAPPGPPSTPSLAMGSSEMRFDNQRLDAILALIRYAAQCMVWAAFGDRP
jgi:hypothetical protein